MQTEYPRRASYVLLLRQNDLWAAERSNRAHSAINAWKEQYVEDGFAPADLRVIVVSSLMDKADRDRVIRKRVDEINAGAPI